MNPFPCCRAFVTDGDYCRAIQLVEVSDHVWPPISVSDYTKFDHSFTIPLVHRFIRGRFNKLTGGM